MAPLETETYTFERDLGNKKLHLAHSTVLYCTVLYCIVQYKNMGQHPDLESYAFPKKVPEHPTLSYPIIYTHKWALTAELYPALFSI